MKILKMMKSNKSSLLALSLVGMSAQIAFGAESQPLVLLKSAEAQAAEAQNVVVNPPSGFDEGTETQLSPAQVGEILPWANNSKIALSDLLESTRELSAVQARDVMVRGIQDVVLASAPKRTETLMRYVLNRALKVNREIQTEADVSQPGVVDQQIRLLRQSILFALRYYESDVAFLNGVVQRKVDPVALPFAQFGAEYASFLMTLDYSIFDASAQYNVAVMALQLMQWDLYRDQNHLAYAPVIARIDVALKTLPTKAAPRDSDTVALLRQVKKTYLTAVSLMSQLGVQRGNGRSNGNVVNERGSIPEYSYIDEVKANVSDRDLGLIQTTCGSTWSCYFKMLVALNDQVVETLLFGCNKYSYSSEKADCTMRGMQMISGRKMITQVMQYACSENAGCFFSAAKKSAVINGLVPGCNTFSYSSDTASCFNRGINEILRGTTPLRVLQVQCGESNASCYQVQVSNFAVLQQVAGGCNTMSYSSDKAACYYRAISAILQGSR